MSPSMQSECRLRRRVAFHETDMAGVVHFSCYFRYMEEAEHALWRAAGLSIAPADHAMAFPRVAASFDFRRPLRFEDEFDITIQVAGITNKTIRYTCALTRGGAPVADGTMTIVCVTRQPNGDMSARPLPADVLAAFEVHADAAR